MVFVRAIAAVMAVAVIEITAMSPAMMSLTARRSQLKPLFISSRALIPGSSNQGPSIVVGITIYGGWHRSKIPCPLSCG